MKLDDATADRLRELGVTEEMLEQLRRHIVGQETLRAWAAAARARATGAHKDDSELMVNACPHERILEVRDHADPR